MSGNHPMHYICYGGFSLTAYLSRFCQTGPVGFLHAFQFHLYAMSLLITLSEGNAIRVLR